MSTTPSAPAGISVPVRRQPVMLVFCCTLLGAAAQILMKHGAIQLAHPGLWGMITSPPLLAGYTLYGISTVLLVLALKDGELSLLYPVISLTFVWVTALSFTLFHDRVSPIKLTGIALIIVGVAVLGRGGRK